MSLTGDFTAASPPPPPVPPSKRPPPFSLRLSNDERARLEAEARGAPLGAYIKSKVLAGPAPAARPRRNGLAVEDRQALARALAALGASRLSSNVNQLAKLAHIGALVVTPELEAELAATLADIREVRSLLIRALGLKAESAGAS